MNAVAPAVLLSGLETSIRDAEGDSPEYELMVLLETILSQAGSLNDENPLDTGIVALPVILN